MQLGIFAKTFPGTTPGEVLAAARDAGYATVQYNMACSGLPSLPDTIAPEVIDRLFEAFTTTKSAEKGTGLGLSLARTVVTNMEGSISVSNTGEGACFMIRLPIPREAAVPREVA